MVTLSELSDSERLAFFLNLHNLLVLHVRIAKGISAEGSFRDLSFVSFLKDAKYKVGEFVLSGIEVRSCIHVQHPPELEGLTLTFAPARLSKRSSEPKRPNQAYLEDCFPLGLPNATLESAWSFDNSVPEPHSVFAGRSVQVRR